jgi:hypothetical protein
MGLVGRPLWPALGDYHPCADRSTARTALYLGRIARLFADPVERRWPDGNAWRAKPELLEPRTRRARDTGRQS